GRGVGGLGQARRRRVVGERRRVLGRVGHRLQEARGGPGVGGYLGQGVLAGQQVAAGIVSEIGGVVPLVGEVGQGVEGGLVGVGARVGVGQRLQGDVAQAVARVAGGVLERVGL